jgi:tetratricopeptide (TPR) repeat protein
LLVWDLLAVHASIIADMESHGGIGTRTALAGAEGLSVAQYEVQMHDPESAALRLKTTPVNKKDASDVALAAMNRAMIAEEQGDLPKAANEWDVFAVAGADPGYFFYNPVSFCYSAVTYQKTGQPQKADAALDKVGALTFVQCYRFRGGVLDLRGAWAGAQEWYEKTVKLVPSSPVGYYSWGVAPAKHGDLANQKGPHWADPLKASGDVLVKQVNTRDALAKYDEALKYAPYWNQLKEARDAVSTLTS